MIVVLRADGGPDFEKPLGLGLETPEFDPASMRGRGGGTRRPMGGMGRGMGMGMGKGGGRGIFSRPEPLSHWLKIRLARP